MEPTEFVQITRRARIPDSEFFPAIFAMYEAIRMHHLPPQILTKGLTVKRARNVVTPRETPIPDCVTCGVCCGALLCVGVRPGEEKRLTEEDYWEITADESDEDLVVDRYLRRDGETLRCKFLRVSDDHKTTCDIYDRRPQMCHDFDAGSDKCHALRRAYGIEPYLTVDEHLRAMEAIESQPMRFDESATIAEAKFEARAGERLAIIARMMDESTRELLEFDPKSCAFMQFEFDALTLSEAERLIAERLDGKY